MRHRSWVALAAGTADGALLTRSVPHWARLGASLAAPRRWVERVGADQAAGSIAQAALWLVGLWLLVGLGAAMLTAIPGRLGALGRWLAARMLPALVVRAIAGATGLTVVLAPVAAGASSAGPSAPLATSSTSAPPAPASAPVWPTDTTTSQPAIPAPTLPVGSPSSSSSAAPASPTLSTTAASSAHPLPPVPPVQTTPSAVTTTPPPDTVTVVTGDSLWLIAARRLGAGASDARIEATWPRWYAANHTVVGADPALIHPGTVLHAPST